MTEAMRTWAIIIGGYAFAAFFFRLLGGLDSAGEAMADWARRLSR
jgi:hypothetical protein